MTRAEIKQEFEALLDKLPDDKAQLLLEFALFLKQHAGAGSVEAFTEWEQEIIAAEAYWFGLPSSARQAYAGQTVAVVAGQILDADPDAAELRRRVTTGLPNTTVLYIEAEAGPLPSLVVRSPRFR